MTKYAVNSDSWTYSNYQNVREWLLLALAGHSAGCRLSAGAICLSIYLLPIPQTPQTAWCELRFIQLVTLSLFLSLSTVLHCYTLWTSVFAKTSPPPSSAFVCIGPYPLPPLLGRSLWMTPSLLSMTLCLAFKCRVPTGAEQSWEVLKLDVFHFSCHEKSRIPSQCWKLSKLCRCAPENVSADYCICILSCLLDILNNYSRQLFGCKSLNWCITV